MVEITNQRKYQVLMVDDEFMILKGLERMINWDDLGIELAAMASHGEEALEIIKQQPIDIIITDVNMPRLTGIEFIEELKKENHRIEFIFISGYEKFEYIKSGLTLGASDYLLKPIDREELHQALRKVMQRLDDFYQLQSQQTNIEKQRLLDLLRNSYQEDNNLEALDGPSQVLLVTNDENCSFNDLIQEYQQSSNWLILQKLDTTLVVVQLSKDEKISGNVLMTIQHLDLKSLHQWYQSFRRRIDNLKFYMTGNGNQSLVKYLFEIPSLEKEEAIASIIANIYQHLDKNQLVQVGDLLSALEHELTVQAVNRDEVLQIMQAFINYHTIDKIMLKETDTVQHVVHETAELLRVNQAQLQYDSLHPIVQEAVKYINDHLSSEITLKHLADHLHINVMYLGQLFKKELKQSFSKYLNELRIEKSKQLLIKTQMTIAEVGNEVGYQNQGYFYRMFKQVEGISPKQYRQQYLEH